MKQLSIFDIIDSSPSAQTPSEVSKIPYLHIEGNIPTDLPNQAFISLQREPPLKIHSLGFQPAKSIPEISRWFLNKYCSLPCHILEPFAGSGTTIIESLNYGASVSWLDYNPLSRLICQVKTSPFSFTEVLSEAEKIIRQSNDQNFAPETIQFSNKDFWFQKPVQEGLEILREHILDAPVNLQPILWLAFASTVRKTSDMNDGMILAAKRSHIKAIPKRSRKDVYCYFETYLHKAIEALTEWQYNNFSNLEKAQKLSSENAKNIENEDLFDAVITSPPYINAIDYIWASKFELHWLGLVKNNQERLDLYSQEIGTERISKKEYQELGITGYRNLDNLIEEIYTGKQYKATKGQNELRARVVYKYFIDMKNHFINCFSLLKPGGYYCFAIGDVSKICQVEIPVGFILTEIASSVGFHQEFSFNLLLKNRKLNLPRNVNWANTIKHDTIIVLEKPLNEC